MTTEAASETEVKKEPEKSEEQPAAAEPDAAAQTAEPAAGDGKKEPEQPKPAGNNPAGDNPGSDQPAPDGAAPPAPGEAPQNPEAPPPTSEKKKEKEQPAGKGISRFLPPWLKRQKSQSQEPPKEAPKEGSEPPAKDGEPEQGPEGKEPTPEPQPEAKEPPPEQEEKHSIGSADTQPVKEEKAEDEEVKETEEKKAEEVKKEEEQTAKPEGKPAKSPLKLTKKMKMVVCQVAMLDGTQFSCEVEKRAKGQYLFFKVCEHLNLLEKDYFGLSFKDNADQKCWLDPTKEIKRQIRSSPWQFAFNVKFYPPDPSQLTEDITRYLLCLQLRQDIASGRLPCSFVTHALLGSFSLQAELGDHDPDEHRLDYISDFQFAPSQTKELEEKVVELHKTHRGLTPAQADAQFLENAKKLSMYGVDLHHAKDSEGVDIMLGVCANGLLIYKDRLRINRFAWPKILKISYKRSNFYIKIRPGETEQFESTVGFKLPNHRAAKKVWKVCVEHHTFFRLVTPEQPQKAKFLTLGSKFRYSGRTQAQTRQASSLIDRPAPYFERTSSKRVSRSLDGAPVVSVTDSALKPDASAPALSSPVAEENGREPGLELPSDSKKTPPRTEAALPDGKAEDKSADVKQKPEPGELAEVEIEETVVIEEIRKAPKAKPATPEIAAVPEVAVISAAAEKEKKEEKRRSREASTSSESHSESEEEAEYHPQVASVSVEQIKEEPEEEEKEEEEELSKETPPPAVSPAAEAPPDVTVVGKGAAVVVKEEVEEEESAENTAVPADEGQNGHPEAPPEEEEEEPRVNGDASHEAERIPQVICCSEPPVVKTEMVTISDTFAAQKTEISTKEVPIVHTETKTITYEAAQLDGSGDGEPGVLMTAQTITSESLCTTTTTHITKTLKGGLSETRIEKRIVITGDSDIDHDQALAQAIKEAKEQHPDMSVTRVVVHKETELAEEGED
ncbi:band 4.1-like protein 2 isoform X6 [Megalops cyprinoides]|uniref:band 4.1-like protein 2 isoform X6 n=1 Tax=Megalops cyprinoides TaxID=118141 RepID=UPI00186481CE|nr:band 4.1-like protein 2 isoform X6 [Megalops cyprinoides]